LRAASAGEHGQRLGNRMSDLQQPTSGPLKALLVVGWNEVIWLKEMQLPIAPFPGLGIRIGVYDMLQVESVVVGDFRYDVTCICTFEGGSEGYTEERVRSFGLEKGDYP
jgi:hypothetical protein